MSTDPYQAPPAAYGPPSQSPGYPPAGHPPPGYPPPGYSMPYGAPARAGTNGLAIASLVLGIVWLYGLGSLLAVIFGHVARNQTKQSGQGGRGMATAGIVLGYIGLAVVVIGIIGVVANNSGS